MLLVQKAPVGRLSLDNVALGEQHAALGSWTSAPVPSDIIIYSGHVAIYAGNGQAVHGGWNGYQTVLASVSCSNTLIGYIHVA